MEDGALLAHPNSKTLQGLGFLGVPNLEFSLVLRRRVLKTVTVLVTFFFRVLITTLMSMNLQEALHPTKP